MTRKAAAPWRADRATPEVELLVGQAVHLAGLARLDQAVVDRRDHSRLAARHPAAACLAGGRSDTRQLGSVRQDVTNTGPFSRLNIHLSLPYSLNYPCQYLTADPLNGGEARPCGCLGFYYIRRPHDPDAISCNAASIAAQQPRLRKAARATRASSSPCPAASTARSSRRCWPTRATTSSGSRCSSTTTARRWRGRAPAAPGGTSTTRGGSPRTLGFPHYVLDYENRFRDAVVDEFADAYLAGATPIPCIRCNERVKFRDLLETARDLGADCMATGHYIQRVDGAAGPELHRAADLGARPELFPVLHDARATRLPALSARRHSRPRPRPVRWRRASACRSPTSPTARTSASFRTASYAAVIEKLRPGAAEPGEIVDLDGRVLGRARGRYPLHRRASGAASASAAASRFTWCGSTPTRARSWSGRARRWQAGACRSTR